MFDDRLYASKDRPVPFGFALAWPSLARVRYCLHTNGNALARFNCESLDQLGCLLYGVHAPQAREAKLKCERAQFVVFRVRLGDETHLQKLTMYGCALPAVMPVALARSLLDHRVRMKSVRVHDPLRDSLAASQTAPPRHRQEEAEVDDGPHL